MLAAQGLIYSLFRNLISRSALHSSCCRPSLPLSPHLAFPVLGQSASRYSRPTLFLLRNRERPTDLTATRRVGNVEGVWESGSSIRTATLQGKSIQGPRSIQWSFVHRKIKEKQIRNGKLITTKGAKWRPVNRLVVERVNGHRLTVFVRVKSSISLRCPKERIRMISLHCKMESKQTANEISTDTRKEWNRWSSIGSS